MLYSPINYTGNKSRIVNQILQHFPKNINKFTDVFCGSGIVGLSAKSNNLILNDKDKTILELLKYFKNNDAEKIIRSVDKVIDQFKLTNTYYEGKSKYIEYRHEGLSKYNKENYNKLKESYNKNKAIEELFTLVIYGFNHYIRFNKEGNYNVPVGKVDFVDSLRIKTRKYCKALNDNEIEIQNKDFRDTQLYTDVVHNDFFYFDPPYLITQAPYNKFWTENDEKDLLNLLDTLNQKNIKFALSNVIESNGRVNNLLKNWMKKYNCYYIKRQYLNANYQKKNVTNAVEVLITNYKGENDGN